MTPPFLIAVFATAFLSMSIVLIVRILDIRSKVGIIALCGVMATHTVISNLYAVYLQTVDVYQLSLLLSVLAVYVFIRFSRGWIPALILLALSMGLYPVYLQSAAVLCLLWLIKMCLRGEKTSFVFKKGCLAVLFLVLGGIFFYALWRLSLLVSGLEPAQSRDSIIGIRSFFSKSPFRILYMCYRAYGIVIKEILLPITFHSPLVGCCDVVLCLLAAVSFFRLTKDRINRLRILALIFLVPLGANFIYVFSNGYFAITMRYSIVLYQALVIMMLDMWIYGEHVSFHPKPEKICRIAVPILYFVIALNNTIYSNRIYLKTLLEDQATLSVMTRILTRMEETEGYVPGETTVVLEGDINKSAAAQHRPGYSAEGKYAMHSRFATTYYGAYKDYFRNVLGYPINLGSMHLMDQYKTDPRVIAMKAFPDPGCCEMIDGMLIVKLSEDMDMPPDLLADPSESE